MQMPTYIQDVATLIQVKCIKKNDYKNTTKFAIRNNARRQCIEVTTIMETIVSSFENPSSTCN